MAPTRNIYSQIRFMVITDISLEQGM